LSQANSGVSAVNRSVENMCRITASLLALVILAACAAEVKGPKVEITPPEIVIKSNTHSGSTFCPPGQAKKGRC
jgi:hypothetical protein